MKHIYLFSLFLLVSCAGGQGLPSTQSLMTTNVAFSIAIPQKHVDTTSRKTQYISPNTVSADIQVNTTTPQTIACTTVCTGSISAPIGTDTFTVKLYDKVNAAGNILSQGTITQDIKDGQVNTVSISFNGVIASLNISDLSPTFVFGRQQTSTILVTAYDASGNTIAGTYATPITIINSDISNTTTLSPSPITTSETPVTLTYNGSSTYTGSTLTASSGTITSTPLIFRSLSPCYVPSDLDIHGYQPCDFDDAYNLPLPSDTIGIGKTVAIIDYYYDKNIESDLAYYRAEFHLSPCTTANGCFAQVATDGGPVDTSFVDTAGDWNAEQALDVEAVSAICPNCHILLLIAGPKSDLYPGIATAKTLGADVVSMSFYTGTNPCGCSYAVSNEGQADLHYFKNAGITMVAASGDTGYSVNLPAESQYVVAVGGTSLVKDSSQRGWNETVWNDIPGSTASGCSVVEPKPTWQTDPQCAFRTTNDVSADSDPFTGMAIYNTAGGTLGVYAEGWEQMGGTSLATPLIASLFAMTGETLGTNAAQTLYARKNALHDVISGNDGTCLISYLCTAGIGYDGPSGIGTPNGLEGLGGEPTTYSVIRSNLRNSESLRKIQMYSRAHVVGSGCTTPVGPKHVHCANSVVEP